MSNTTTVYPSVSALVDKCAKANEENKNLVVVNQITARFTIESKEKNKTNEAHNG